MFPFILSRTSDYYELLEDYNRRIHNNDLDNVSEEIIDESTNETNNDKICIICYDIIDSPFYDYNIYRYIHNCKCKPTIHVSCFELCMKRNIGCVICRSYITINFTLFEKIRTGFIILIICLLRIFIYLFFCYIIPALCMLYIFDSLGLISIFHKIERIQECENNYISKMDYISDMINDDIEKIDRLSTIFLNLTDT